MSNYDYNDALESVNYLKQFIISPIKSVIVAGSGLGGIAKSLTDKIIINTQNIPHWPISTAPSHSGNLIIGKISSRPVLLQQGRLHFYEGYSMKQITFPVRVFAMLGITEYIATNASGAINKNYSSGEIIAVRDHINLMGDNPLIGENDERWNERFPDMTHAYDKNMLDFLIDMGLKTGIYASFTGPSFETPSEVNMARLLGADVAGMSTVPEVIVANAMKLRVCVLSCAANMAAGIDPDKTLSGQEVIDVMNESSNRLADILIKLINKLNQE